MILGTAAYMAPEQAAGSAVDRRADVWAFGVVLYEMLTGSRLFEGETVTHVLAAVLKDTPNLGALPAETPARIVALLASCLRKKPRERLQAIGDARVVIEEVLADPRRGEPLAATPRSGAPAARAKLAWAMAAAGAAAAALFAALWLGDLGRGRAARHAPRRRSWRRPGTGFGDTFALSPDGRRIVFSAFDQKTRTGASLAARAGSRGGHPARLDRWRADGVLVARRLADRLLRRRQAQAPRPARRAGADDLRRADPARRRLGARWPDRLRPLVPHRAVDRPGERRRAAAADRRSMPRATRRATASRSSCPAARRSSSSPRPRRAARATTRARSRRSIWRAASARG